MGWGLTLYSTTSGSKQEESEDKKCFAKNGTKAKSMSALQAAQSQCAKSDGDPGEPLEVTPTCTDPLTGQAKVMEI